MIARKPPQVQSLKRDNKSGGSQSRSMSYDYTGADIVQKRGDDLSSTSASRQAALYNGDISAALATGRRISDLSNYINAYRASGGAGGFYDGVYGEVAPRVRIASESGTNSGDVSSGRDVTMFYQEQPDAIVPPPRAPAPNKPAAAPAPAPLMPVRPLLNNGLLRLAPDAPPPVMRKPDPVPEYPPTSSSMFGFNFPSVFGR